MSDSLRPNGPYSPWNSPGQSIGVGSHSLLQGIFPTQGLNPGLPHCRQILYQLSHQWSPRIPEWVAYPFFSGSSRSRNQTWGLLHCRQILNQLSYQGSPHNPVCGILNGLAFLSYSLWQEENWDDRGWDGWMASLTRWTWVWANSGSWWWTGKPGVLQSMGLQRVRYDWATELSWTLWQF